MKYGELGCSVTKKEKQPHCGLRTVRRGKGKLKSYKRAKKGNNDKSRAVMVEYEVNDEKREIYSTENVVLFLLTTKE